MARQHHSSKPAGASGIEENRGRKASDQSGSKPNDATEKLDEPGYQHPSEGRPYFGSQEPEYGEGGAFGRQQDDSPTGGQVGARGSQENIGGTIQRPAYPSGKTPSETPSPKEPKS